MIQELTLERELELRREVEAQPRKLDIARRNEAPLTNTKINSQVHAGVFTIYTGMFVIIIFAFYAVFSRDAETVFMIAICIFYGTMYFGTPLVLQKASGEVPARADWSTFLSEPIATHTGPISGRAALIQICIVPTALAICVIGICLIIAFSR